VSDTRHNPRVGFIGLGPMGHGMAKNLVTKGYPLTILGHRRREPVESLVAHGAVEASDLRALADRSDVVILCLPSSAEIEGILLGDGGLLSMLGTGKLVIDSSTADPVSTVAIGQQATEQGVHFLDAPLTRTPAEAEAGKLNVILGGEEEDCQLVEPILRCFAENIVRSGPLGSAHRLKLLNNFLSIACSIVVSEAVIAAQALGVDTVQLHRLASMGGANSGALQMIMPWINDRQMSFRFSIRNAEKDIRYFSSMLEEFQARGEVGAAVERVLGRLVADGAAGKFMPEIADQLARKLPR
jgi:3-hydroxyisobutyrate dehydrogenase-like beta-hydroxyacid dehydrogenase